MRLSFSLREYFELIDLLRTPGELFKQTGRLRDMYEAVDDVECLAHEIRHVVEPGWQHEP